MARRLQVPRMPEYGPTPSYYRDMARYERACAQRGYRQARKSEEFGALLARVYANNNGEADRQRWEQSAVVQREHARESVARAKRYDQRAEALQARWDELLKEANNV